MRLLSAGIAAVTFMIVAQHLPAADVIPPIDESKYVLPGAEFKAPDWVERRKGAPFPVKEFLERPIDPSKNAAPLYIYAMSRYLPEFEYLYSEDERASYKARTKEFREKILSVFEAKVSERNANVPEINTLLNETAPLLKMIDQAQTRPECVFYTGLQIESSLNYASSCRAIACLDAIQIASASEQGDFKAAEHSLQRTLRLSRDISPLGPVIPQFVVVAINAVILDSIREFYLPNAELGVEDCDRILNILRNHDETAPSLYDEGLRSEYVLIGNIYERLESGNLSPDYLLPPHTSIGFLNFDLEWKELNCICKRLIDSSGDFTLSYKALNEIEKDAMRMKEELEESNKTILGKIGRFTGFARSHTSVYVPTLFPHIYNTLEAFIRNQTRLNALQMAIAVRRYQLAHGRLPDTLDVAAKEAGYEEALIDPYDGQKLRFVVLDGQPIVYSVATDRIDQGGKADWRFGRQPGDFLYPVPQPKNP